MTTTITAEDFTGDSTQPLEVLGYETAQESRNITHDIIGGGIAASLIPPRPRAGTLELGYLLEDDAEGARLLHGRAALFALVNTDRPTVNMTYMVTSVGLALEDETRDLWLVRIGYQEVPA